MTVDHIPSPSTWVRDQVQTILRTGTTESVNIQGRPVVLITMRGRKTGGIRLVPVMRVEHEGRYVIVGSKGGSPHDPQWVHNLRAHPDITLQDGTREFTLRAREANAEERAEWWPRCVEAFPPYAEYQTKTDRVIPIFVLDPA
jgi:deazaflavin-dependent oxidoreductase (nitroreductase family)